MSVNINSLKYYSNRLINSLSYVTIRHYKTGDKVSVSKNVTDNDVINFAKLTNDFNPIHIDPDKKVVHGALLNGFLSGVLGTKLPGPGTIVLEQFIRYPKPCYPGDKLIITVEILSARKIIKCNYSIVANSIKVVLEGEGKFIASKAKVFDPNNE